ncbi:HAMP domain-containing sensor histidine kinase, partial [Haloarculaceae archaeon H-GB1-1]|nr:HAMP domain-containing sensor histidine kinase [Haloarculaceae archaeon H-GB1-1]
GEDDSHGRDPSLTVTVGDHETGFFVADDGPGIPEAVRDDLFAPGVSGSETGTGLGLAIVSEIVDAHGWSIRAEDGPDGGARFVIGVEEATAGETDRDE